ncbi:hypothetical protein MWU59_04110 [Flavobacteriaceae bacterium F08102]|nr:hypothetical protein [Flavobacteriaceae bacterium F08102]
MKASSKVLKKHAGIQKDLIDKQWQNLTMKYSPKNGQLYLEYVQKKQWTVN